MTGLEKELHKLLRVGFLVISNIPGYLGTVVFVDNTPMAKYPITITDTQGRDRRVTMSGSKFKLFEYSNIWHVVPADWEKL